jgi:parvulin-like peptidyl-prolyl isomerase
MPPDDGLTDVERMRGKNFYIDIFIVVAAFILAAAGGCRWFGDAGREDVATVDGEGISLADMNEKMKKKLSLMVGVQSLNERQRGLLKRDVLNELIDEKVMINRADKLGISVKDSELKKRIEEIMKDYPEDGFKELFKGRESDYKAWMEDLRKRLILEKLIHQEVGLRIAVTDEEILSYLKTHAREGLSEKRVHLSQILLPDRDKAEAALERLNSGEDFAAVAKEVSTGPEAEKGGDMGFFSRGVLPETLERAAFSLSPGKISRVVETPYGYHIVKVLEKETGGEVRSVKAREKVRAKLKREKEERAYHEWLEQLRSRAVIKINESALSKAEGRKNQPAQE